MRKSFACKVVAGFVVAVALCGFGDEAVTATWIGTTGSAWTDGANWDTGVVPGLTTNVKFSAGSSMTVTASGTLPTFATMMVVGKGVTFNLSNDARMTSSGPVSNVNTTAYSGGAYAFDGNLVIGKAKGWIDNDPSYSTSGQFENCVAEIGGLIQVSGYSGNGLKVKRGAVVTSGGYVDRDGTRNASVISEEGVFHSTGDISIRDSWPNDSYPCPLTVDGGTVTNDGAFTIAAGNAGNVPVVLKNGATWRQAGVSDIACKNTGNSLQILSGSSFESTNDVVMGSAASKSKNNLLVVDGASTLKAKLLKVGNANRVTNHFVRVSDRSRLEVSGTLYLGACYAASNMTLSVDGGSSCKLGGLQVGSGKSIAEDLSVIVSNSSIEVANSVKLPYDTTCRSTRFVLSGAGASAEFKDGLVIGAGSKADSAPPRLVPTEVLIDDGVLVSGTLADDGSTSGDTRLGGLNVGGEYDKASNRVVVAGNGCFVVRHRCMSAGNPILEFRVPEGGYMNSYGCGLQVKNGYLTNANFVIDLTRITQSGEYVIAKSTANDLNVDLAKVTVRVPENCRYVVKQASKASPLSVEVKFRTGMILIFR